MRAGTELSNEEARWLAVGAQGLAQPRPKGPIGKRHLRSAIAARSDSCNSTRSTSSQRTQFLVLFSRLGAYDVGLLHDMTGPGGELFEYWGHAASLLPMAHQPLFRWRMEQHGTVRRARRAWRDGVAASANADYIDCGPRRGARPRAVDGVRSSPTLAAATANGGTGAASGAGARVALHAR